MNIDININYQLFDEVRNNNFLNVQQLVLNGADVNRRDHFGAHHCIMQDM